MFRFILKAFLRDKNRSVIPAIVVAIGVFLTISIIGFLRGTMGDMIDMTAKFQTGHMKVMTRAFADNSEQLPNDLCLLEVAALKKDLSAQFPDYNWEDRIHFGGLIDYVDTVGGDVVNGQGTASVMAIDMKEASRERMRLNIEGALVRGEMPQNAGDVLLGDHFAEKLGVELGDTIHFMGSTMNGSMCFALYRLVGTLNFGNAQMNKSMMMMDIVDARQVMDMEDGASVILGFHKDEIYFDGEAVEMSSEFNTKYENDDDEFLPIMLPLRAQNGMEAMLLHANSFSSALVFIFIIVMGVVLWNTGLVAGLRRYQEFGIRLALGESKNHIYKSLVTEAVVVGLVGSFLGTLLGLALVYYLQVYGVDISEMMPQDAGMMMPSVLRAKFDSDLSYLGFIPGVFATIFGALLSGKGIYKRETSRLMKEMEV